MTYIIVLLLIGLAVVLGVTDIRREKITRPVFKIFKEFFHQCQLQNEAMESGMYGGMETFCWEPRLA